MEKNLIQLLKENPPVQMTIEPKAIEILKAACDRLAAARSMSFTAAVTYENPSRLGPPLAYTFTDLIVADPYKDVSDGMIMAFYIGQSKVVGGTTTDMVAYPTLRSCVIRSTRSLSPYNIE